MRNRKEKPKSCCVAFCQTLSGSPGILYHRFPGSAELVLAPDSTGRLKKTSRATLWKQRLRTKSPLPRPAFVCSGHFHDANYLHSSVDPTLRFLKKAALPTRNLPQYALMYRETRRIGAVTSDIDVNVGTTPPPPPTNATTAPVRTQAPSVELTIPLTWPDVDGFPLDGSLRPRTADQMPDGPPGLVLAALWQRAGITLRVWLDLPAYRSALEGVGGLQQHAALLSLQPHWWTLRS